MCDGIYPLHLAGGASETAEEREIRSPRAVYPQLGRSRSPKLAGQEKIVQTEVVVEQQSMLSLVCWAFVASGSEQYLSARAILAHSQPAPWNREDWKDVQPRSGTEERSECRRIEKEFSRWLGRA